MLNKYLRFAVDEDTYALMEAAAAHVWSQLRPDFVNDDALAGQLMEDLDCMAQLPVLGEFQQMWAAVLMVALQQRGYACVNSTRVVHMPVKH